MRAMIDRLNASDAPAVVVLAFEPADAQQYGRVITEGDRVVKMVEHKDATPEERAVRSEEHTSELQSLMRISYAVFCLKKKTNKVKQLYKINLSTKECTNNKEDNEQLH